MISDMATSLKPDVYRAVVVVLVPGFVCCSPWLAYVLWPELLSPNTWEGLGLPISVSIFMIVLAAGLVMEDIGSRIEVLWADRWLRRRGPRLSRQWLPYLALTGSTEAVAIRYLRATLVRFKFELSMIPACVIAAVGLSIGQFMGQGLGLAKTSSLVILLLLIALWFLFEVRAGAFVLAFARRVSVRVNRRGDK